MAFLQVVLAFIMRALPIIGPEITAAAGVAPHDIGILAGTISIGITVFLLGGNMTINYYGPVRILQIGAVASAVGIFLSLTAVWWILIPAAFLIGLGYGPSPAAASDLLIRTSPPSHRTLIMSTKQAGVPLGFALAGILLPALVGIANWQVALLVTAVFTLLGALVVQPWRKDLDTNLDTTRPPTVTNLFAWENLTTPLRILKEVPGMLPLTAAVACFSCSQACLLAFFVTQLTVELGFSLTIAGVAFSVMQVAGTLSRVVMGWLADRITSAKTLLLLAVSSTAMFLLLANIDQTWPTWTVLVLGFVFGVTSISWNGVFLAEAGRLAPVGKAGDTTSGSMFFVLITSSLGPFAFSFGVPLLGGYSPCFFAIACIQFLAVPSLLRCIRLAR